MDSRFSAISDYMMKKWPMEFCHYEVVKVHVLDDVRNSFLFKLDGYPYYEVWEKNVT